MKHKTMMLVIPIFILGFSIRSFAQVSLPEVIIKVAAANYKYLKSVSDTTEAQPVKMLQKMAATYDVKNSSFYEDEYQDYFISFFIPQGEILAAYDQDGKLLRTVEKYKDMALPTVVRKSVIDRFPQWSIAEDTYLVNYSEAEGGKKVYKLTLINGDKRLKVKTNEKGEFL